MRLLTTAIHIIPQIHEKFRAGRATCARRAIRANMAEVESGVYPGERSFHNFSDRAGCGDAARAYPAYQSSTDVGLISAAPIPGRIIKQLKEFCCANH